MMSCTRRARHLLLAVIGAGALAVAGCTSTSTAVTPTGSVPVSGPATVSGTATAPDVAGSVPGAGASVSPGSTAGGTTAGGSIAAGSGTSGAVAGTGTAAPTTPRATTTLPSTTAPSTTAPSTTAPATTAPPTATSTMKPGNINATVPSAVATTKPPVPLSATATFGGNVSAALTKVAKQDLEAHGPGEFAGAGVVLTISMVNGSAAPIDLSAVGVTVVGANKVAALPVQSDSAAPFSGQLLPGRTATGQYAFSLHSLPSNPVTVSIDYSAAAPVVAFTGSI